MRACVRERVCVCVFERVRVRVRVCLLYRSLAAVNVSQKIHETQATGMMFA
jgi:hypothetical protein